VSKLRLMACASKREGTRENVVSFKGRGICFGSSIAQQLPGIVTFLFGAYTRCRILAKVKEWVQYDWTSRTCCVLESMHRVVCVHICGTIAGHPEATATERECMHNIRR
jgi:hypothetical protein